MLTSLLPFYTEQETLMTIYIPLLLGVAILLIGFVLGGRRASAQALSNVKDRAREKERAYGKEILRRLQDRELTKDG